MNVPQGQPKIARRFNACLYPHVFWIWIMLVNMQ